MSFPQALPNKKTPSTGLNAIRKGGGKPGKGDTVPTLIRPGLGALGTRTVEPMPGDQKALTTPGEVILDRDASQLLNAMVAEFMQSGTVDGKPPTPSELALIQSVASKQSGDIDNDGFCMGGKIGFDDGGMVSGPSRIADSQRFHDQAMALIPGPSHPFAQPAPTEPERPRASGDARAADSERFRQQNLRNFPGAVPGYSQGGVVGFAEGGAFPHFDPQEWGWGKRTAHPRMPETGLPSVNAVDIPYPNGMPSTGIPQIGSLPSVDAHGIGTPKVNIPQTGIPQIGSLPSVNAPNIGIPKVDINPMQVEHLPEYPTTDGIKVTEFDPRSYRVNELPKYPGTEGIEVYEGLPKVSTEGIEAHEAFGNQSPSTQWKAGNVKGPGKSLVPVSNPTSLVSGGNLPPVYEGPLPGTINVPPGGFSNTEPLAGGLDAAASKMTAGGALRGIANSGIGKAAGLAGLGVGLGQALGQVKDASLFPSSAYGEYANMLEGRGDKEGAANARRQQGESANMTVGRGLGAVGNIIKSNLPQAPFDTNALKNIPSIPNSKFSLPGLFAKNPDNAVAPPNPAAQVNVGQQKPAPAQPGLPKPEQFNAMARPSGGSATSGNIVYNADAQGNVEKSVGGNVVPMDGLGRLSQDAPLASGLTYSGVQKGLNAINSLQGDTFLGEQSPATAAAKLALYNGMTGQGGGGQGYAMPAAPALPDSPSNWELDTARVNAERSGRNSPTRMAYEDLLRRKAAAEGIQGQSALAGQKGGMEMASEQMKLNASSSAAQAQNAIEQAKLGLEQQKITGGVDEQALRQIKARAALGDPVAKQQLKEYTMAGTADQYGALQNPMTGQGFVWNKETGQSPQQPKTFDEASAIAEKMMPKKWMESSGDTQKRNALVMQLMGSAGQQGNRQGTVEQHHADALAAIKTGKITLQQANERLTQAGLPPLPGQ